MIYVITGHLGSGKSLLAVSLALEYLRKGRAVASNLTLNLEKGLPHASRRTAIKLPGVPSPEHLESLGRGYEGEYDEDLFGLVLLDEAGTWLNSHDWRDKDRRGLFHWVTHARKFGWDVALIIQDYESLDAQIRRSVSEIVVRCSRLDRIKVPYIPLSLPRVYLATGRYQSLNGPVVKRWFARGDEVFPVYDTRERISHDWTYTESGPVDARASWSMLSAWHVRGRYLGSAPQLQDYFYALALAAVRLVIGVPLSLLAQVDPQPLMRLDWPRRVSSLPRG